MKLIVEGEEIFKFIPQRPPIVMVDAFYGLQDNISKSSLTIDKNNMFCQEKQFAEPGIIEHIAQSAAVRVGYIYTQNNQPVPLGFIGSVDKLSINFLPKEGDTLYTEITVLQEVLDITLISAEVKVGEELVATCKMKIFLKQEHE